MATSKPFPTRWFSRFPGVWLCRRTPATCWAVAWVRWDWSLHRRLQKKVPRVCCWCQGAGGAMAQLVKWEVDLIYLNQPKVGYRTWTHVETMCGKSPWECESLCRCVFQNGGYTKQDSSSAPETGQTTYLYMKEMCTEIHSMFIVVYSLSLSVLYIYICIQYTNGNETNGTNMKHIYTSKNKLNSQNGHIRRTIK